MPVQDLVLVRATGKVFNSQYEIEATFEDDVVGSASLEFVHTQLKAMHHCWTRFDKESELSRLNATSGTMVPVSPLLWWAVDAASRFCESTDGLYDPTVDVAALGYENSWPDVSDRFDPRPATGPGAIRLEEGAVRIPKGYAVDLGGIAKGLAADWVVAYLSSVGAREIVANCGGDVAANSPRVVDALDDHLEPWCRWKISSGGVCTSSAGSRSWSKGHHIVDPRTGLSARTTFDAVSVHAASAAQAEVAAKVAFITGVLSSESVVAAGLRHGLAEIPNAARAWVSPLMRTRSQGERL